MVGNRDDGSMELTYLGSVVRFVEVKLASTPLQYLQGAPISPSASRHGTRAWMPGRLRRATRTTYDPPQAAGDSSQLSCLIRDASRLRRHRVAVVAPRRRSAMAGMCGHEVDIGVGGLPQIRLLRHRIRLPRHQIWPKILTQSKNRSFSRI
jgi:hypothetical protein